MHKKKASSQKWYQYLYWLFKIRFLDGYSMKSYSQEGEDLLLYRIFETKRTGFYVDVGAHHPKRFSNTYLFYKKGWKGINIDAMPGSMNPFNRARPRDINIETPVTDNDQTLTYYMFRDAALNGFSSSFSSDRLLKAEKEGAKKIKLKGQPLAKILDAHLPPEQHIDFLSIDAEGHDLNILQSNKFSKYSPEYILVEILYTELTDLENHPVYKLLTSNSYKLFAKLVKTCVFKKIKPNENQIHTTNLNHHKELH